VSEEIERDTGYWSSIFPGGIERKAYEPLSGDTIFDSIFFPVAVSVASRTIGMDLVSVQPMSGPSNDWWFDRYKAVQIREERDKKIDRIFGDE
jgi:hypothetical protein